MTVEPDFLRSTRISYDRIAEAYAHRFHTHLLHKPVDRAMLIAFAGLVAQGNNPHVIDAGCGTGYTTGILHEHGLEPVGLDLSEEMLRLARHSQPDLPFTVGSMIDMDVATHSVGGVCAWYSIIHISDEYLSQVFTEFARVLQPGVWLLLAFQVGDTPLEMTDAFGTPVELCFHRRKPENVESQLHTAGFHSYARLVREADADGQESTPHAYLIARTPR